MDPWWDKNLFFSMTLEKLRVGKNYAVRSWVKLAGPVRGTPTQKYAPPTERHRRKAWGTGPAHEQI
jgi:hypothetical protein